MRLAATSSLIERDDVIIIATVSCIYGLGNPTDYSELSVRIETGMQIERDDFIKSLINIQYERDDQVIQRARFRVQGDTIDLFPAYTKNGIRVEFFGDEIDRISQLDLLNNKTGENLKKVTIYPAKHFVTTREQIQQTTSEIRKDLDERVEELNAQGKDIEARRLRMRTEYDIEMMLEIGTCKGIENYSRYLSGRSEGSRPSTLIDFFPDSFITFIDESPCDDTPDWRHVQWRPIPKTVTCRLRVQAAFRTG
jgi:excinuclease ABC subunit B